jgi:glutamate N-acetyltransferase/amino-acid N-acetyltransferase
MIVVDGDTSPNDTVILVSTGRKKGQLSDFQQALYLVCRELAVTIASDGEGATKLMVVKVTGAKTTGDARRCARAIISSPLVKTAVTGADPNFGRVLSVAGNVLENLPLDNLRLSVSNKNDEVTFFSDGGPVEDAAQSARKIMQNKRVDFILDLNSGEETATAWGCDLTADYVRINAEYST